jgi:hypothetical protein
MLAHIPQLRIHVIATHKQVSVGTFGYSAEVGCYPLERLSMLSLLQHEVRRPTVIEKWSPYEVAKFESALCIHGKVFHKVTHSLTTCILSTDSLVILHRACVVHLRTLMHAVQCSSEVTAQCTDESVHSGCKWS